VHMFDADGERLPRPHTFSGVTLDEYVPLEIPAPPEPE
jgi:hypothetical protein